MKAIKWINKFSNESGFVMSLADGHFINTWEIENAVKFRTQASADKTLDTLYEFGEDANNDFEIIDVPAPAKTVKTTKTAKTTAVKTAKTAAKKSVTEKKTAKEEPAAKTAVKTAAKTAAKPASTARKSATPKKASTTTAKATKKQTV